MKSSFICDTQTASSFINSLANGIIILNQKFEITDVNTQAIFLLGMKRTKLVGKNYIALNPFGASKKELANILETILKKKDVDKIETLEFFFNKKKGFYLKKTFTPLKLLNKVYGIIIEIEDVTNQVVLEESLKESESSLKYILQNANDSIITLSPKGEIKHVNQKALVMTGYSKEELVGKNYLSFVPKKESLRIKQLLKIAATRKLGPFETEVCTKKKGIIPVEISTTFIRKNNKTTGILAIIRDLRQTRRLEKELASRYNRLNTLFEVGKTASKSLDLQKNLNLIASKVPELVDADACTIFFYNKNKQSITPVATYNLPEKNYLNKDISITNTMTGMAIKSKKVRLTKNAQTDPNFNRKSFARKNKIKGFMSVPIILQSEVMGAVNIYSKKEKIFTNEEIRFIKSLANYTAIIIKNTRLFEDIQQDKENLHNVLVISQAINSVLEIDKLLSLILEKSIEITNASSGVILLKENDKLVVKATSGYGRKLPVGFKVNLDGKGLCPYVAKTGLPLIVANVEKEKKYYRVLKNVKSEAAFPLIVKGEIIGVLNLDSVKPNAFEKKSWMLSILSNNAAIAINNAELYDEISKKNIALFNLYDTSTFLQTTMDVDTICKTAIETFKNLGYDRVRVYLYDEKTNECYGKLASDIPQNVFDKVRFKVIKKNEKVYQAFTRKQPVVGKTYKNDPNLKILKKEDVEESASFPLYSMDKKIGLISIDNKYSKEKIEPEKLTLLMVFANQIAVAIENATLYNEINKFNEKLSEKIKQATKELEEKNKKLMELDKMKTEFVSIVSHELKTPLTSIKGYISLLLLERIKEKEVVKRALKIINEEADRLTNLINDVLDLSRLESRKVEIRVSKVDIREAIKETTDTMIHLALEKNIKIVKELQNNISAINGDKDKIKQIVSNLLSNSLKFTDPGGKIIIKAWEDNDFVLFSVEDTGCGIPKEEIPNLGNKFFQVESHMTRHKGGTGLGLAIVKQIVGMHNGIWSIDSEKNQGTKITIALPKFEIDQKAEYVNCWNYLNCEIKSCPQYYSNDQRCWLMLGVSSIGCKVSDKDFIINDKIKYCRNCPVYNKIRKNNKKIESNGGP